MFKAVENLSADASLGWNKEFIFNNLRHKT